MYKLKHFKMEKKYCKKSDQDPNQLEYPECSICLMQIDEGQDTILLPCGHMFHDECSTKWLKIHNTCPLCRFELPTDDAEYERERSQRNQQREAHMRNNPNIHPIDFNHPENISNNNNNENNNQNSQSQNNNSQNQGNINQNQNNNNQNQGNINQNQSDNSQNQNNNQNQNPNNQDNQNQSNNTEAVNINIQGEDMSDI